MFFRKRSPVSSTGLLDVVFQRGCEAHSEGMCLLSQGKSMNAGALAIGAVIDMMLWVSCASTGVVSLCSWFIFYADPLTFRVSKVVTRFGRNITSETEGSLVRCANTAPPLTTCRLF